MRDRMGARVSAPTRETTRGAVLAAGSAGGRAGERVGRGALATVEAEVRELVRRRDVDPVGDRPAVVRLVDDVLADYERRSALGAVPPLVDLAETARCVLDAVAGLGPLQRYLDDPSVEEIWVNSPETVFVARNGVPELTTTILDATLVRDLVESMLRSSGRRLDRSSPFVDATLPGGERLHVVIPDVTRTHMAVNIRKHVAKVTRLRDLVGRGSLTPEAATYLDAAVRAGLNVVVAGSTQAGKTTMLNALAGSIPRQERVIVCEEVFELQIDARDHVAMQCRQPSLEGTGEVPLRRLVKEALRMRPDRIVIGEVREAESLDLLIALNAGIPGLATLHASSAREALVKLCTLPLLAGPNISADFVVPTVAAAVDVVVHLSIGSDGGRRVQEIRGVPGRVEEGVVETCDLFHREGDRLVRGQGFPPGRTASSGPGSTSPPCGATSASGTARRGGTADGGRRRSRPRHRTLPRVALLLVWRVSAREQPPPRPDSGPAGPGRVPGREPRCARRRQPAARRRGGCRGYGHDPVGDDHVVLRAALPPGASRGRGRPSPCTPCGAARRVARRRRPSRLGRPGRAQPP
ncbi:hypothetical protein GCM10025865_01820 [Paraoerskovia sediminicola]|uniref:Bacterial type II secretion system protein E domain-containing protein n=1 Tax=Paraoerskovia sediminicola TaxID=1138587 RepID=A0ABM8FYP2_9CELL|nr:hypothetical protein GCM10025865_01820 [Paraoerskovia sediminicola]